MYYLLLSLCAVSVVCAVMGGDRGQTFEPPFCFFFFFFFFFFNYYYLFLEHGEWVHEDQLCLLLWLVFDGSLTAP
jgi:hypothetical protein